MPIYDVTTNRHGEDVRTDIVAHYFVTEDGFTTFKDPDHKQVATFNNATLVSIIRTS